MIADRPSRLLSVLAVALAPCVLAPDAFAQPSPTPAEAPSGQAEGPPAMEPHQRPAFAISAVETLQAGGLTTIRVRGVTTTSGWREPTLVPLVRSVPSDGVLDLVLLAEPPPEAMPATGFAPADAVLVVAQGHPYRGVRVRSATNVVKLDSLAGKAEAALAGEDCRSCVGRTLSEAGSGDSVARGSLPRATRVLMPSDPFPDVEPNPNRLTLLVGNDGKVIEAVWQ